MVSFVAGQKKLGTAVPKHLPDIKLSLRKKRDCIQSTIQPQFYIFMYFLSRFAANAPKSTFTTSGKTKGRVQAAKDGARLCHEP